jgi:hypothetical protein
MWSINVTCDVQATSLNTKVMLQINTFEIFVEVYARPLLSLLTDFQALLANQVCEAGAYLIAAWSACSILWYTTLGYTAP